MSITGRIFLEHNIAQCYNITGGAGVGGGRGGEGGGGGGGREVKVYIYIYMFIIYVDIYLSYHLRQLYSSSKTKK